MCLSPFPTIHLHKCRCDTLLFWCRTQYHTKGSFVSLKRYEWMQMGRSHLKSKPRDHMLLSRSCQTQYYTQTKGVLCFTTFWKDAYETFTYEIQIEGGNVRCFPDHVRHNITHRMLYCVIITFWINANATFCSLWCYQRQGKYRGLHPDDQVVLYKYRTITYTITIA